MPDKSAVGFRINPKLWVVHVRHRGILIGAALGVACGLITTLPVSAIIKREPSATILPDFSSIEDVSAKKKAFFDFLLPIVERENVKILNDRARVEALAALFSEGKRISKGKIKWLKRLAEQYEIPVSEALSAGFFTQLMTRVDIIPPSLALAQAANESGWGGSRFAVEGNNLFGIWCYTPGCGIVPKKRAAGVTHEVKKYKDIGGCVKDYLRNLNKNGAYKELRFIRARERRSGRVPSGHRLASGLVRYSSMGQAYVKKIQSIIRVNGLAEYDT